MRETPIGEALCTKCKRPYLLWATKGRICEHCGHTPVEVVPVAPEGVKFDAEKPRWDLLPFEALDAVAEVLRYGAKKYEVRGWEKGMAWGRLLGAAMRHLAAWARGNYRDSESQLPHLAHAACCVLMLLALTMRGVGTDDRDRESPECGTCGYTPCACDQQ